MAGMAFLLSAPAAGSIPAVMTSMIGTCQVTDGYRLYTAVSRNMHLGGTVDAEVDFHSSRIDNLDLGSTDASILAPQRLE
jgi:hypothetical protein